ncbi:hypothetical protein Tco_0076206, partial [Tanacetum coccineum]
MLDHQLEICQDTVGNELTTAVQLIAFLKKQIADSRRPKVAGINLGANWLLLWLSIKTMVLNCQAIRLESIE